MCVAAAISIRRIRHRQWGIRSNIITTFEGEKYEIHLEVPNQIHQLIISCCLSGKKFDLSSALHTTTTMALQLISFHIISAKGETEKRGQNKFDFVEVLQLQSDYRIQNKIPHKIGTNEQGKKEPPPSPDGFSE